MTEEDDVTEQAATVEREAPSADDPRVPSEALVKPAAELPAMISNEEFRQLWRISEALAKSGLFKDARQAGQAFAKVLAGRDLGLSPFEAMAGLHVIEGKIEASSDLHATRVRQQEGYDFEVYWIKSNTGKAYPAADDGSIPEVPEGERVAVKASEEDPTDLRATVGCAVRFLVDGEQRGVSTWTIEDTLRANLQKDRGGGKSPHVSYPRNMYFARAMTNGVAWYVPEAMGGLRVYGAGEIQQGGAIDGSPDAPLGVADEATMAEVPWPPDQALKDEMRALVDQINALDPHRYSPPTLQMLLGGRTLVQHAEIRDRLKAELATLREKAAEEQEKIEDAVVVEGDDESSPTPEPDAAGESGEAEGRAVSSSGDDDPRPAPDAGDVTPEQEATIRKDAEKLAGLQQRKQDLEDRLGVDVRPGSDEHVALSQEIDGVEQEIRKLEGENPDQGALELE